MSDLEENLNKKLVVKRQYVAMCEMNQCARPTHVTNGNGEVVYVPTIIALEDSEGLANQKLEVHRNSHRQHEKEMEAVLAKHRAGNGGAE